ncbi:MAG: hypothetical protein ABIW85_00070 [Variovorax sp.]
MHWRRSFSRNFLTNRPNKPKKKINDAMPTERSGLIREAVMQITLNDQIAPCSERDHVRTNWHCSVVPGHVFKAAILRSSKSPGAVAWPPGHGASWFPHRASNKVHPHSSDRKFAMTLYRSTLVLFASGVVLAAAMPAWAVTTSDKASTAPVSTAPAPTPIKPEAPAGSAAAPVKSDPAKAPAVPVK